MHAMAPAPKKPKAPEVKMTLVQFLGLAHEQFGISFPEQVVQMAGKSGDNFTDQVKNVLCSNGWKRNEMGALSLANANGMVCAYLRTDSGIMKLVQNWYGGFLLTVPFPEDQQMCAQQIRSHMPHMSFFEDADIDLYRRSYPGLCKASINVNTRKVTYWNREDVDKRSEDFQDWIRIFERLFNLIDLSESGGFGERMFDTIHDPYWQWTDLSREEVEQRLKIIANSAETPDEVLCRVRDELKYQFDTIYLYKKEANHFRPKSLFFIEIIGPGGHHDQLIVNGND